ncbi:acyl- oxidase [Fusarium acutatum]|uniref:Acyl- oxidase n=1 Tax=Fusarium acutatum TaxID=78861 RepID=A0A8H4JL40_9HYPO|nr:acyl- oxidase [Fusarium acutatum]
MRPSEIESSKMKIFKEIITRLDQVWLISIQKSVRQMTAGESGRETIHKTFFERSFPIHVTPHSFDLIGPDPRTIENDLSHLHLRSPKRLYDSWLQVLERIEVEPCEERYRLLLAFKPRQMTCNLRDAEDWLKWEDSTWTRKPGSMWPSQEPHIETVAASETPEFRDEDLSKAVRPALGFWLFPVDAFCDENKTEEPQGPIFTFDVRKHRPELALLRLNEGDADRNVSKEVDAHHDIASEPRLLESPTRPHPGRITLPHNRSRAYGPSFAMEDT